MSHVVITYVINTNPNGRITKWICHKMNLQVVKLNACSKELISVSNDELIQLEALILNISLKR